MFLTDKMRKQICHIKQISFFRSNTRVTFSIRDIYGLTRKKVKRDIKEILKQAEKKYRSNQRPSSRQRRRPIKTPSRRNVVRQVRGRFFATLFGKSRKCCMTCSKSVYPVNKRNFTRFMTTQYFIRTFWLHYYLKHKFKTIKLTGIHSL